MPVALVGRLRYPDTTMPYAKLNTRQEAFCRRVAEGLPQSLAYIKAGYTARGNSAEANAAILIRNPKVAARFAELQAKAAKRNEVTVDTLFADLEKARQVALACNPPQTSAAVAATMGMAKLTGLLVERREVAVQHKPAFSSKVLELSEEEWRRQFDPQLSNPQ